MMASSSTPAAASLPVMYSALNGPDSPPVLFQAPSASPQHGHAVTAAAATPATAHAATAAAAPGMDENEERCRSCHSTAMYTDWKQGDIVCTNCGLVAESHIRDDRPEWKDFHEAEDIVKGRPSGARSGLVPVDETRYIGGLQPTKLSSQPFGGPTSGGYGLARLQRRLKATNRRVDDLMEKRYHQSMKDAKLDRKIRLKRGENSIEDNSIRPEMDDLVLQEEEDAHRIQQALYAEKWSLDRAFLLYGDNEVESSDSQNQSEEREELLSRLDSTLRRASQDLYTAYTMMTEAARSLQLPDQIRNEIVHRLVQFVIRKDGFHIKNVASRLLKRKPGESVQQRKKAANALREYNKRKVMAAMGAGIIFLTARSLGWPRSITEVCSSFKPPPEINAELSFIKAKHCSRAMQEIKQNFPEFARVARDLNQPPAAVTSTSNQQDKNSEMADIMSAANFAEHSVKRLQLPPVAEACIRTLVIHLRQGQLMLGHGSGTKLPTLCAAAAFFVCTTGSIMQRLAQQVHSQQQAKQQLQHQRHGQGNALVAKKRSVASGTISTDPSLAKRAKLTYPKVKSQSKMSGTAQNEFSGGNLKTYDDKKGESSKLGESKPAPKEDSKKVQDSDSDDDDNEEDEEEEPFDVFKHAPIIEDPSEKQKYEMRRMWDAWAEQMSWSRTSAEVEQSVGVSRKVISEYFKKHLFVRRAELLNVLQHAVSKEEREKKSDNGLKSLAVAPLAPILLVHVNTAAPLMPSK